MKTKGLEERITSWLCESFIFQTPKSRKSVRWDGDMWCCLLKQSMYIYLYLSVNIYIYTHISYIYIYIYIIFLTSLFNAVCCGLFSFVVHPSPWKKFPGTPSPPILTRPLGSVGDSAHKWGGGLLALLASLVSLFPCQNRIFSREKMLEIRWKGAVSGRRIVAKVQSSSLECFFFIPKAKKHN